MVGSGDISVRSGFERSHHFGEESESAFIAAYGGNHPHARTELRQSWFLSASHRAAMYAYKWLTGVGAYPAV